MSKLASCNNGTRVLKAIEKAGFLIKPGGKHALILTREGELVSTVPRHRSLNVNTLRKILRQCGLSEQMFVDLY